MSRNVSQLLLVDQAAAQSDYDKNYIRFLVRKGLVKGEKHGGVWLVDLDSLKEYEARMKAAGSQKHTPSQYRAQDDN